MWKTTRTPVAAHDNAMGFVRLVLAILVIVSHTPEMVDGNRGRELLTSIFGTISFGELAVDGFFVVSGYLIVASYAKSATHISYLQKRVGRIFPGFAMAIFLTLMVAAPLAGGDMGYVIGHIPHYVGKIATLQPIYVPDVLAGMPIRDLNASVWTISYEFRCYLLVILLGTTGLLHRRNLIAVIAVAMLIIFKSMPTESLRSIGSRLPLYHIWLGEVDQLLRLFAMFLVGSLFYTCRNQVMFTKSTARIAASGLLVFLCFDPIAELGVAIFGGYLIFGFAAWGRGTVFSRINNRDDISYGVYLYAWPVGTLAIYYFPTLHVPTLIALTIAISAILGFASWRLVERPALRALTRVYGMWPIGLPQFNEHLRRLSQTPHH